MNVILVEVYKPCSRIKFTATFYTVFYKINVLKYAIIIAKKDFETFKILRKDYTVHFTDA